MFFSRLRKPSTFLKYLLSYILIFTVLMFAFFLILRTQLANAYSSQQTQRIQAQMAAISAQLKEEFQLLLQVDTEISNNSELRNATLYSESKYLRVAYEELSRFDSTSNLIGNIILHSHSNGRSVSVREYIVSYDAGVFSLTTNGKNLTFDTNPLLGSLSPQLIWLEGENSGSLLYFPKIAALDRLVFFYELDTTVLLTQIKSLLSDEVPGVALLDSRGRVIVSQGLSGYADDPALSDPTSGIRALEDGASLFLSDTLHSGLHLAAVVSGDYLTQQVDSAFLNSVMSLLGLSLLGIGLVYVAMLFTYRPLQRFVKSLGHETGGHRRYLDLLSENYLELNSQKAQLEQTLAQYRESLAQYRQRRAYPHEDLEKLSAFLTEKQIPAARDLVEILLNQSGDAPDYFHTCIALDCLTMITNSMSQVHIKFETYRDVFTEAVHQCREIPNSQSLEELKSLINELLFFYERETVNKRLHITPLRQLVEANFCDPGFSISTIARTYHVSDSRMSTLFKEEMGIGFTDCIWQMRLKKARELLRDTELSVDEISLMIGYLTPNSFRRKFKQQTGMTPSQYRAQCEKSP